MSKSQIVLIAVIAGVLWYSKDYLATKKDMVVSQVDEFRASQQQNEEPPSLQEFGK